MQEGIDFVRCLICGLESGVLNRHIVTHGLTSEAYQQRYPGAKLVADAVRDSRSEKLRAKPHKEPTLTCKYCGGKFNGKGQRRAHERREEDCFLSGEEGKDFIVCLECGLRDTRLNRHVESQHGMSAEAYREKHPGAPLVVGTVVKKQVDSNTGKRRLSIEERAGSAFCEKCNTWYLGRNYAFKNRRGPAMSKRKADTEYWAAIDLLYPKHRFSGGWGALFKDLKHRCTDNEPNGWGNYGCKRCEAIVMLEKRGRKIWPRSGR